MYEVLGKSTHLWWSPVPYPQVKARDEHRCSEFLEMLKKFCISNSFLDAIADIPSYAKFLKDLLSNKGKLLENAIVSLIEKGCAIIQNKHPPKLLDPGRFSIPCPTIAISTKLCDLWLEWASCHITSVRSLKWVIWNLPLFHYNWLIGRWNIFWNMFPYKWRNSSFHVILSL